MFFKVIADKKLLLYLQHTHGRERAQLLKKIQKMNGSLQ